MMGGGLFMILILGVLIYLALPFFKKEGLGLNTKRGFGLDPKGGFGLMPRGDFGRHESAEEMLKKRYARGEISKEEFDRMKKDIAN